MNWISYRNRIEKQMLLYINFLPFLPEETDVLSKKDCEKNMFKLLDEIQFLKLQIQRVDRMTVNMAANKVSFSSINKTSKNI